MGGIRGSRDDDATRGEDFVSGESSFRFPITGDGWNASHSGGVGLSPDNVLESGCLGNKGLTGVSVIETIGGSSDDDATGGDSCGVILGNGGMSHGRGMRSSDEGPVIFLMGGNGISSGVGDLFHGAGIIGVASLCGGDGVSDWGNGMSTGSLMIIGGGS